MIGKEVLNYTIVSLIGKGGMGSVYLAEHKYIKQQKVAIKVINKEMVNDFTREKLKEEAEHLASLNHQNIVHFLDYHIDEDGNIYLIMEYAEGLTLDRYIKEVSGLIVESRICPIFEPILDAVGYAHKHGILHRDIKPANIVISADGVPKILDFGISTIISADGAASDNMIMGTPSYMSPEQVKGEHLDERSDIYALGVVLHQMLTGRAPYDTTTLNEHEINERVVNEPLPRLQTFYKYVSDKMQKVVDKATAKRREDRYQSCAEFKKALHNAVYPPKVARGVWIAAAVAVVLVLGGSLWWWDYNRVKIRYYKDYVEQWGIPQGIGKLSKSDMKHRTETYKFEFQQRKLRRMSFVNSHGKIVEHHDSERMERSSDMQFFYGDKGKLSYVKILDRSGRVLYKKAYNDKLNTVIFQYDDKNGTEFVLNASTLGFLKDPFENSDESRKGRISRYLLTYDDNGYVTKLEYAGVYNVKVGDAEGIFSRSFKLDDKGRVIEERFLGYDGKPKATQGGMGIKRHTYAKNDDFIETAYYTVDGEPSTDASGVPVVKVEYDKYGNRIKESYVNEQGELVMRSDIKASGLTYEINDRGECVKYNYFGLDGNPCYGSDGVVSSEREYDDNGYLSKMTNLDADGNPCFSTEGFSSVVIKNDEHGNMLDITYLDTEGKPIMLSDGYSRNARKYNEQGILIEELVYDVDNKPALRKDGTSGYRVEVNEKGLTESFVCLDADLKPVMCLDGYAAWRQEFDVRGNCTKITFCQTDGKTPIMLQEGYAGWTRAYDENGNTVELCYFDDKGKPCENNSGMYRWTAEYNDRGEQIHIRKYNLDGKLVLDEGNAGEDNVYDERGNLLENKEIGLDGQLAKNKLLIRYKYDERDNNIEVSLFDRNNNPAINSLNYHKWTGVYNSRNQLVESRYYNTADKLTTYSGDRYAIERNEYDNRGNNIRTSYFGTDEKPVVCNEGWAITTREYDIQNRLIKQSFFGIDGKPTDPDVMVPEGFCGYDQWGNINYVASGDGKGNLIDNPNTGWCIKRSVYNLRGNIIEESYFDSKDKPANSIEAGCHKIKMQYDKAGNCTEVAFFNADGSPSNGLYGYHRETREYDSKQQLLSMACFDSKGQATNCNDGYHRIDFTYSADGEMMTRKVYTASGALLLTQRWNGAEWENIGMASTQQIAPTVSGTSYDDWKQTVADMNSELPLDLGDNAKGLVVQSLEVTGSDVCRLTCRLPMSKYEISASDMSGYSAVVDMFVEQIKSESLPSYVDLEGVLYDSKGRMLYSVKR